MIKDADRDILCEALLTLKTKDECKKLLDDLFAIQEVNSLVQRLKVAVMLKEGKTYNEISERTSASTATISRVNRTINYGSGGYNIVLERLKEKEGNE